VEVFVIFKIEVSFTVYFLTKFFDVFVLWIRWDEDWLGRF
jgi:hypothetical protein